MEAVKSYFNTQGFERWRKIYGETEDVNKVQLDIRQGHAQTVDKVLSWLSAEDLKGTTICDAGCGTGSLAIPLALRGAQVAANDISAAMVGEAERRFQQAAAAAPSPPPTPTFQAQGLEEVGGSYHTVACIDVLIHYPDERTEGMVGHLASLATDRIILSFAPKTPWYSFLKRVGELFPGPSKATRAYLHTEEFVEACLAKHGFQVTRKEMTATQFYFSRLFEAKRVSK